MKFISSSLLILAFTFLLSVDTLAQSIPVGDIRESQFRFQQLLNDSLSHSFSNRSIWMDSYRELMEEAGPGNGWWNEVLDYPEYSLGKGFHLGMYEPVLSGNVNSGFPYGENNGAAWYGRGLTAEAQGGIYITSDYLTLNLNPHLSYQQNSDFDIPRFAETNGSTIYGPGTGNSRLGVIMDRPFRMGPDPYWNVNWGHSSLGVHYQSMELGYSSEPMWWGPAVHYPLVMSNNAPGIERVYLRTREPIHIPYFGDIEFTWTGGWPKDSEWYGDDGDRKERRMVGLNLNWSFTFAPHLYIGLTRVYHMNRGESTFFSDFLRVVNPFYKAALPEDQQQDPLRDTNENQLASVYFRWLFPEANAEIYAEYLREDHSVDARDFVIEPHNNRAWSFGVQKLIQPGLVDYLKVDLEYTHLIPSRITELGRAQGYIYENVYIIQGHTNEGQVLGAAIGPGSDSFYLGLEAYLDNFRFGLFGRRLVENDQFHLRYNADLAPEYGNGDIWRHRVNMDLGATLLWKTGSYVLTSKLMWTKAYNYGRYGYGDFDVNFENYTPYDVGNMQFQVGVRYLIR